MGQKTALKDTLYQSPKYKTFVDERNIALERIESNAQLDISRLTHESLESITGYVSHMILTKRLAHENVQQAAQSLDSFIHVRFQVTTELVYRRILRLRRAVFVLSYLGELEAIARATQRTMHTDPFEFKSRINAQGRIKDVKGKLLSASLFQAFHKLKTKILNAFISAVTSDKKDGEILEAVQKVYPPIQVYKRPPRALKPIHEANSDPKDKKEFDFYHNLTNDDDWDLAVKAYKDTELPPSRFDDEAFYNPKSGTMQYSWELEQDVTDDFVKQVRDGQVQAATDLGVKDFVWVAVIDKKTCEVCCMPRAGKTTSEIEAMLSSGDLDKDECDAVTPPAHPYCRCDIAPVASTDPVEGPDWKDFNDWLNS